jgi:Leucine-rich repeat (LRR) protein
MYINNNQLNNIPSELGQSTNLICINIANNNLSNLPCELGQLDKLKKLDLSNNKLVSIPYDYINMSNLEELNIENNDFFDLHEDLCIFMKKLKYLQIDKELEDNFFTSPIIDQLICTLDTYPNQTINHV